MSKGFSISLSGLQPILKKLKDTEDKVIGEIDLEISESTQSMALTAKQLAPKDVGRLASAIGAEKVNDLNYDLFCKVMYAPYIEFGTKKYVTVPSEAADYAAQFRGSKGKGTFKDLQKNIIAWGKRKGIDEKTSKYIALIIARDGIRPQPFFFPAIRQHRKKLIDNIIKILREKRG